MNLRKIAISAFVAGLAILITSFIGCERIQQIVQPPIPQMEGDRGEILIGAVYPITGRFSSAHPPMEDGIELAVEEINNAQRNGVKIQTRR